MLGGRVLGFQGLCAIGVLHPLEQDEHLAMWGLREQVHGHSLDWPEGSALHPVRWGSAETMVGREQSRSAMWLGLL